MTTPRSSSWKLVALGLRLKLAAMWLIFPSVMFPFLFPSFLGLLLVALVPLTLDLVGRCLCAWAPVRPAYPIRLSILAQSSGILVLTVASILLGPVGVDIGLILAAILQASAAKWFIVHLKAIALAIEQPALAVKLEGLRTRLMAVTISMYSTGAITVVVLTCAIFFGLMAYYFGVYFTVPIAVVLLMPLLMSTMVIYFFMLYSYEHNLSALRSAIYALIETNLLLPPIVDQPLPEANAKS